MKLLGEESRFTLLSILQTGSYCVSELIGKTNFEQSLISHHLKDLKDGGLVESSKTGRFVHYSLTSKGKQTLAKSLSLETLKLLKDDSRQKLLTVLGAGTHCVSDLIRETGLEQSLISHHLKDLRDGGLVKSHKEGRWVFYET